MAAGVDRGRAVVRTDPARREQAGVVAALAPGSREVVVEGANEPRQALAARVEGQQVAEPDGVEHRRVLPRAIGAESPERRLGRGHGLPQGDLVAGRPVQQQVSADRRALVVGPERAGHPAPWRRRGRRTDRRARAGCDRARRACAERTPGSRRRRRRGAAAGRAGPPAPPSRCVARVAARPSACRRRGPGPRARTGRPSSPVAASAPRPSAGAAARSRGRSTRCRRNTCGDRRARAGSRHRPRRDGARSRVARRRRTRRSVPRGRSRPRAPG